MPSPAYHGRLAPTPTGELHLGHARTFHQAWRRAREAGGRLSLRIEDLDRIRCRPEYTEALLEDLQWLGIDWDGDPLIQSQHRPRYLEVWKKLRDSGHIYPCTRSRKELRSLAPAETGDEQDAEPLYPPDWRPPPGAEKAYDSPEGVNWRFRVSEGEVIRFSDLRKGEISLRAGVDFGDFSVWRRDNIPAYELSVVVDDIYQQITEVVRGEDLLRSTVRQLLLYRALNASPPAWCHEALVRDAQGIRLAKRFHSLSLREMRRRGKSAEEVLSAAYQS
ncbi:MAG: tRNA glutamyl-Q(34) synthetase GluQRS [Kiritimatiellia bacterium]